MATPLYFRYAMSKLRPQDHKPDNSHLFTLILLIIIMYLILALNGCI